MLGADNVAGSQADPACEPVAATRPQPVPARRERAKRASTPQPATGRPATTTILTGVVGAVTIVLVLIGMTASGAVNGPDPQSGSTGQPSAEPATQATVAADGAQELTMQLQYPRYAPRVMEAKAGVPLRLTLEAIGDPG